MRRRRGRGPRGAGAGSCAPRAAARRRARSVPPAAALGWRRRAGRDLREPRAACPAREPASHITHAASARAQ